MTLQTFTKYSWFDFHTTWPPTHSFFYCKIDLLNNLLIRFPRNLLHDLLRLWCLLWVFRTFTIFLFLLATLQSWYQKSGLFALHFWWLKFSVPVWDSARLGRGWNFRKNVHWSQNNLRQKLLIFTVLSMKCKFLTQFLSLMLSNEVKVN